MLTRAPTRIQRDWICDSRQWDGYRPREGDVVIATAPKVGTTWTQQIVNLLVFQTPEPRWLGALSPWIDCRFMMPIEAMLGVIEGQQHRRFLKSHLSLDALPIYDEVKYIHVARDGRDSCMSFLNHFNSFTPDAWAGFDAIGAADETIAAPFPRPPRTPLEFFRYWIAAGAGLDRPMMSDAYFDIERSFWDARHQPNILLVHYNDLKTDLGGEMQRIAGFLDIRVPAEVMPALVEAATFEAMQRDGPILLAGIERAFEHGAQSFLHKGTNDRWRDVLTEADLDLYDRRISAALPPDLVAWLAGGRLKAGDPVAATA